MLTDLTSAPVRDSERVLFAFVELVARKSSVVRSEDVARVRQAGWSDEAIYDAITVCALFRFYNTWVDASGVNDMPPTAYQASGKLLAQSGYAPVEHKHTLHPGDSNG